MANNKKNYNKISAEKVEKEVVDQVVEATEPVESAEPEKVEVVVEATEPVESAEPEKVEVVVGKVTNCSRLNIRKKANKAADVIKELAVGTKVEVSLNESTKSWYKVKANGVEGFCMVDYITLSE